MRPAGVIHRGLSSCQVASGEKGKNRDEMGKHISGCTAALLTALEDGHGVKLDLKFDCWGIM